MPTREEIAREEVNGRPIIANAVWGEMKNAAAALTPEERQRAIAKGIDLSDAGTKTAAITTMSLMEKAGVFIDPRNPNNNLEGPRALSAATHFLRDFQENKTAAAALQPLMNELTTDPRYNNLLNAIGREFRENHNARGRYDDQGNSVFDRLNRDITAPTESETNARRDLLTRAMRENPDAVAGQLDAYQAGTISFNQLITAAIPNATITAPVSTPQNQPSAPSTATNQNETVPVPSLPATAAPTQQQLPSQLTLISYTGMVEELCDKLKKKYPGMANEIDTFYNRITTEDANGNNSFRDRFISQYNNQDGRYRGRIASLLEDLQNAANQSNSLERIPFLGDMIRGRMQGSVREMISGDQLLDENYLAGIQSNIDRANSPWMRAIGGIVNSFFSFFQGLGITGPEIGHQMLRDGKDLATEGLSRLPVVGQFFAGNGGQELTDGLGRTLSAARRVLDIDSPQNQRQLSDTRSILRENGAANEYVFLRNGRKVGEGYILEPLRDAEGNNIRDTIYARNIDRHGRGYDFDTIPENDGLMKKSDWEAQEATRRAAQRAQQPPVGGATAAPASPATGPGQ